MNGHVTCSIALLSYPWVNALSHRYSIDIPIVNVATTETPSPSDPAPQDDPRGRLRGNALLDASQLPKRSRSDDLSDVGM